MKTILAAATVLGALAIGAPAMAEVTGSVAYSTISVDPSFNFGTIDARVAWDSTNWFGVEGVLGIGVKDDTFAGPPPVKVKVDAYAGLYATARIDVNPNFSLRAKLGYDSVSMSASAGAGTASANGTNLSYGLAAQYLLDGRNGLRADWTALDTDGAQAWSLGLVHKF